MTGSLKRSLTSGTAWLSGSDVFVKFFGLVYLFVVLTKLSVFEYGLLKLALSIPALLSIFSLGGLHAVMVADLVALKRLSQIDKMRDLTSSFFSLKLLLGITASLGLFVSTFVFADWFHENTLSLVRVLSLLFLIGPFRSVIQLALNVSHNFRGLALFAFAEEGVKLLLVIFSLWYLEAGIVGIIWSVVITEFLVALVFSLYSFSFFKELFGNKLFSGKFLAPFSVLYDHAKWSVFLGSFNTTLSNTRLWIVQFLLGTEAVGLYGLAMSLLTPLGSLLPISKVVLPIAPSYKNDFTKLSRIINSAIKYKLIGQAILVTLAFIGLPFLITNYFPNYQQGFWLFVALTPALIPQAFSQMWSILYSVFQLQKDLFKATVLNSIMMVIVLPISIYLFGTAGLAVEFFLTVLFFAISRYRRLRIVLPKYNCSIKEILFFNETDKWLLYKCFERLSRVKWIFSKN